MKRITTFSPSYLSSAPRTTDPRPAVAFSYGHWTYPEKAHGYKRTELDQWRELSKLGNTTTDRHALPEQATLDKVYEGRGEIPDIEMDWPTVKDLGIFLGVK